MVRDDVIRLLVVLTAVSSLACQPAAPRPMHPAAPEPADLRVTKQHLVALCLDGRPVDAKQRRWQVEPGEHTLTLTMRNDPRWPGAGGDERPGRAVIRFRAEPGGRYEVETRADPFTYSRLV